MCSSINRPDNAMLSVAPSALFSRRSIILTELTVQLFAIPAFYDNYIWLLADDNNHCLVVDPGDAAPVERFLADNEMTLGAILITHHHPDHVGGLQRLTKQWPVPVYGPDNSSIAGITHSVYDGDRIALASPTLGFDVLEVPGHTLDHIAFYSDTLPEPLLFCGDTLFSAGCGRLFEGTPEQMDNSLQRLTALPDHCRVCCTHEYTEANLRFALAVLPEDPAFNQRSRDVAALRAAGQPSLPSTIGAEKISNPFLRVDDKLLQISLENELGKPLQEHNQRFAALRAWKDRF
jgi:hydroxyacylglutathione hydrolase